MLDALAWSLIHFLWQGALIACLAEAGLRNVRRPLGRYRVACGALVAMAIAPVLTVAWLLSQTHPPSRPAVVVAGASHLGFTPWVVGAWAVGVFGLAIRTAVGLVAVERLRWRSIPPPPGLADRFRVLAAGLDLVGVELRLVAGTVVPMAVGVLRPAVLIPASLLARLPPDQLEALILHELAHVRRMDWLVNLTQSVVETLLFYHPAVWWLSRRIRHLREVCCDEMVLASGSPSLCYARALTEVESMRAIAAPAANGGDLMDRILNIVGQPPAAHKARWVAPTLAAVAILGLTSAGSAVASVTMKRESPPPEAPAEDTDRPVAPEDVGAKALQMIADQLELGARNLEEKADARHARREARRAERRGSTRGSGAASPPPPAAVPQGGTQVVVRVHDHGGPEVHVDHDVHAHQDVHVDHDVAHGVHVIHDDRGVRVTAEAAACDEDDTWSVRFGDDRGSWTFDEAGLEGLEDAIEAWSGENASPWGRGSAGPWEEAFDGAWVVAMEQAAEAWAEGAGGSWTDAFDESWAEDLEDVLKDWVEGMGTAWMEDGAVASAPLDLAEELERRALAEVHAHAEMARNADRDARQWQRELEREAQAAQREAQALQRAMQATQREAQARQRAQQAEQREAQARQHAASARQRGGRGGLWSGTSQDDPEDFEAQMAAFDDQMEAFEDRMEDYAEAMEDYAEAMSTSLLGGTAAGFPVPPVPPVPPAPTAAPAPPAPPAPPARGDVRPPPRVEVIEIP